MHKTLTHTTSDIFKFDKRTHASLLLRGPVDGAEVGVFGTVDGEFEAFGFAIRTDGFGFVNARCERHASEWGFANEFVVEVQLGFGLAVQGQKAEARHGFDVLA